MKQKHPAITKITSPDLPEVMLRHPLFDVLDRKQHYRITWIAGMAGSGKTTLAASYLATRRMPCLWYQLDERDIDLPTFFYYLGLAARKALPRMRKTLPLLMHEDFKSVVNFSQGYFEALCARLSAPFFMVFDDFQNVDQASAFPIAFQKGLAKLSPDIHVLILSRSDPPPAFAGMLANKLLRVVGPGDLRLTLEESAAILHQDLDDLLPEDTIRQLHQKTRGWAAGLILMAKHLARQPSRPLHIDTHIPSEVYDYFVGELFDTMDDRHRDFLLKTAFLPVMTAATARALTGQARAGQILSAFYRNHLFIERFSAAETTYQYHPLFRKFLLAKAETAIEPDHALRIRQQAAALMESTGRIEDAAELYADIDDTPALVRLIHLHALSIISQGRLEILNHWLQRIPDSVLSADPWLLFWLGMSFRPSAAQKALQAFQTAFEQFNQAENWNGIYLAWAKIVDSTVLAWDDFKQLDPWIRWLDTHPFSERPGLATEITAKVASCMSGALIIRQPHHPRLPHWIETALELSQEAKDISTRLKAVIWAVTYYLWIGDFAHAAMVKERARKFIQQNPATPVTDQFWRWLEISADARTLRSPAKILKDVLKILEDADKKGQHLMDQMFFPTGMFAALLLQAFSKADTLLARFGGIPDDTHRHGHAIFHHFKGLYLMLRGQEQGAFVHAETALKMVRRTGYVFYEALCLFQMAHLLQRLARFAEAEKYLKQAAALSLRSKSRLLEFMCLLEKARIALIQTKRRTGLDMLHQAMSLGRESDFTTMVWWWDPVMIAELCAEALTAGIEGDYACRMIGLHHLTPPPGFAHLEAWPWKVKVYTFGRFRILINEKPLAFKGRYPRKPLELLQVLIALGGTDVPVGRVLDALWYDADGDLAHSAFSTALNRLRTLLGIKDVIRLKNGMLSLAPELCWVDALCFQRILAQADDEGNHRNRQASVSCHKSALELYSGKFLAGERNEPWMISARERMKNSYLNAILRLGRLSEQAGKIETALTYYEKGLAIDDLMEPLYRRMMSCQLQLGRHADVVRTYRRCRTRLAATLDVPPSPETEAVYRKLRT